MLLNNLLDTVNYRRIINKSGMDLESTVVSSVCCDSRKAYENSVFVCISGALYDGHEYAMSAYSRMCRIFVAQHELELPDDAVVIIADDTRTVLADMSAEFFGRPSEKMTVIGITGTKGKTTTSLLIYNILNANGIPTGYIGSNGVEYGNYHFETVNTTPESYDIQYYMSKMLADGIKTLVMEVSSQALMLGRVRNIKFSVCVFTNLYPDHIGKYEHPDFDNYMECKHSLFTDYGAEFVVYNGDDPHSAVMTEGCNCPTEKISVKGEADYSANDITFFRTPGNIGVSFMCRAHGRELRVSLPFPGEFSVYNALTSIAVCRRLGLDLDNIVSAMEKTRIKGRFQTLELPNGATVVIDYAHNGVSLKAALGALRIYRPSRLICLFGSVGGRTKMRRAELGLVASREADLCIITSDNPDNEPPLAIIGEIASYFTAGSCPYIAIPDRKKAIEYALANSHKGDIILLAGKGHETYQLVCGVREHFSEEEIVENYCMENSMT